MVLDPFSGSFTTGFMAKQLGRKSISIEIQKDYIKIGLRRLGLATEFNGEQLIKEGKTTKVKNRNGIKAQIVEQPNIFGTDF